MADPRPLERSPARRLRPLGRGDFQLTSFAAGTNARRRSSRSCPQALDELLERRDRGDCESRGGPDRRRSMTKRRAWAAPTRRTAQAALRELSRRIVGTRVTFSLVPGGNPSPRGLSFAAWNTVQLRARRPAQGAAIAVTHARVPRRLHERSERATTAERSSSATWLAVAVRSASSSGRMISAKWQATGWPCRRVRRAAAPPARRSPAPSSSASGSGSRTAGSPGSARRPRARSARACRAGSGDSIGTAERSACVYGCIGAS